MLLVLPPQRKLLACAAAASFLLLLLYLYFSETTPLALVPLPAAGGSARPPHPIDHLIERAATDFQRLLDTRSTTLHDAATRYRQRRGRHPPPGFDAWFEFASSRNAVLIEDFFDQIYDDLEPFWGLQPWEIRAAATQYEATVISVRNGTVEKKTPKGSWRMDHWADLVNSIAQVAPLPDVDLPMNIMDEMRLVVSWADIDKLVQSAAAERQMPLDPSAVIDHFTPLESDINADAGPLDWITEYSQIWPLVREACPPDSPARVAPSELDLSIPATDYYPLQHPLGSWHGFVFNWTQTRDPCYHPHLRALHGTFIEPVSAKMSKRLVPLFGGSKLRVNNEIVIPSAMYWGDWQEYSGGEERGNPWKEKIDGFVWRGVASGGRNRAETWQYFHRHRFISMVNGSEVANAEAHDGASVTFRLPPPELYNVQAAKERRLGEWLASMNNAGFNDLLCWPQQPDHLCVYNNDHFSLVGGMSMTEQYGYKFLPDVDGNSYSGRYRAFLLSTSLPIKTSIYREWHDARLFPWVHFVPMDNTFIDFYAILEYFAGAPSNKSLAHDDVAQMLAQKGQEWAQQVLRKEDMQIYMYRLLLEYGRVCDEHRMRLGYIADL